MQLPLLEHLAALPSVAVGRALLRAAFGLDLVLADVDGLLQHRQGGVRKAPCGDCRDQLFQPSSFKRCDKFYRDYDARVPSRCHAGYTALGAHVANSVQLIVSGLLEAEDALAGDSPAVVLSSADRKRVQAMLDTIAEQLRAHIPDDKTMSGLWGLTGESPQMQRVYETIKRVAASDATALILGESGTGKGIVARALHENGLRSTGPFVAQNCGALTETLLESTLFGHVRGAFTGAERASGGLFGAAKGGTLFLDEVGEMSAGLQVRLLRVLQDGTYTPVGSTETRTSHVRVVAATHRNLRKMVTERTFREDLFFRLHVLTVELPPLRQRAGDVRILLASFLKSDGLPPVSGQAWRCLERYHWPGNIRELQSEVARWGLLAKDAHRVGPEHLSPPIRDGCGLAARLHSGPAGVSIGVGVVPRPTLAEAVASLEQRLIDDGLERHEGNRTRLAKELGISRTTLSERLRRYGIELK